MDFATKKKQIIKWLYLSMCVHRQKVIVSKAESNKDDLQKQISKKQITHRPLFIPKSWGTAYPCFFTQVQEGIIEWPDDEIIATGPQRTDNCPNFFNQCDCKYAAIKQEYISANAIHTQEETHLGRMLGHRKYAFHRIFETSRKK